MSHFLTQFQLGSLTLIGPSKGGQFFFNYSDYDENHDDYEKYHDNYNNVLIIQNNYQPASIEDQQ